MFLIEDKLHAEPRPGSYGTIEEAVAELRRLAFIPWNEDPNQAPCSSWRTCGRCYVILEYDSSVTPWKQLRSIPALEIRASGVTWLSKV